MGMLTALQRSGGIEALARQSGVPPPEALLAAKDLLPRLLAAFRSFHAGRDGMIAMLSSHGGVSLAADVMAVDEVDLERGRAVLAALSYADDYHEDAIPAILAMLVGGYISALAAGHGEGAGSIDALLSG